MNMIEGYNWMVYIQCLTFNHYDYICKAIDGFTIQETNFPYVAVVIDDSSTDGEQGLIQQYLSEHFKEPFRIKETEYANIICANHKTNPNCSIVAFLLKYNHYSIKKDKLHYLDEWRNNSKYIAFCEGDDYWTSPNKLQMQVDFLEENPNYSATAHQSKLIGDRAGLFCENVPDPVSMNDVVSNSRLFHTASLVFRSKGFLELPPLNKPYVSGDKLAVFKLSYLGPIKFFKEVMCVYRKHESGMSNTIKYQDLITDINIVDYMKEIDSDFPANRCLSFLYGTICLTAKDASRTQVFKCLLLSFVLSFSFFPNNIIQYGRKLINYIKASYIK